MTHHRSRVCQFAIDCDDLDRGVAFWSAALIIAGPQTVNTTPIQERRTIYSAEGEPIGQVFIHAVSHLSFRDANGNGVPDPGEITANVDRFVFTCH
jgi:hypothetical protein